MKTHVILSLLPLLALAVTEELKAPLLPWLPPSSVVERCGGPIGFWEIICGTEKFCESHDTASRWFPNSPYNNKTHCLDAHECPSTSHKAELAKPTALLPWYERTAECKCMWVLCSDEKKCGSAEYCSLFDTKFFHTTSKEHASMAECLSAREPRPEKAPAAKLPYLLEPKVGKKPMCGVNIYDEDRCGTKRYCLAFDHDRAFVVGPYLNAAECLLAHDPPPKEGDPAFPLLKWLEGVKYMQAKDDCKHIAPYADGRLPQKRGLIVCGTKFYCEQYDTQWAPDRRWRNAAHCFAAFELDPAKEAGKGQRNLPWLMPSRVADRCGGSLGFREIICGTARYCDSYDTHKKWTESIYQDRDDCLAAHQPPSSSSTSLPQGELAAKAPLLPWREADETNRAYCLEEEDCGTALYCASFDTRWFYFTKQEYPSSVECLAAREPRPATPVLEKRPYLMENEQPYWSKLRCGMADYTPFSCGTRRYCFSFDLDRAYAIGPYANATECFAAFEPPPVSGDVALPIRGWVEPQARPCNINQEYQLGAYMHCGTKWLCERYDTPLKEDLRYRNSTECFAAFEPRPVNGGYHL
ncbi:hypothetical protein CP533_4655 [Ophiocordyceps camponoti-saundersi (nom. inval.)]|nr:hypothetical protein CP533_4655 [Ophiocordyceps camponoti-saundersi (nom. inval.)]